MSKGVKNIMKKKTKQQTLKHTHPRTQTRTCKQTRKQTLKPQHNANKHTFDDICDLYEEGHEPLNDDTHIFSASFFKLNDMYKDISKYINGLKNLINYLDKLITKHNKNIHLFLYYDKSIEIDKKFIEIKSYLLNKPFVKLIKYYCPEFMLGDMHKGLFGTFVRMFPLFDLKYEKNIKSVIDIDFSNYAISLYDKLFFPKNQFLMNKNDVIIRVRIGYEWHYRNVITPKYLDGVVNAQITFNRISLDSNLLRDTLNKINKGDKTILKIFTKIIKLTNKANKKWHGFEDSTTKINLKNLFIYGIDEYFINLIIFDYLIEHNKKIGIIYNPDYLNVYISHITKWDNYDTIITKQFFKEFLKQEYNDKDSIKQCIDKGKKLIFVNNVINQKQFDIQMNNLERLYNLMQKYSNKIKFDNDYIKNIKKTLDNKNYLFVYNGKFNMTTGEIRDYIPQVQYLQ